MNILSLFPKQLYDTKMSPGRTLYLNHVGLTNKVVWSGHGWDNWSDRESAVCNVSRIQDSENCRFDAIVMYKQGGVSGLEHVDISKIVIFNEAHDDEMFRRDSEGADIIVFHHYGDMIRTRPPDNRPVLSWSHAAPVTVDVPWEERNRHMVYSGCTAESVYPVRTKIRRAVNGMDVLDIPHPGYRMPNRASVIGQYVSYLKSLSSAKISICCTSIHEYPLAKLIESAMCGCVVATDMPNCPGFEKFLWPHCIQIKREQTEEEIRRVIASYSDDQLREMGAAARDAAKKHFSYDRWSAYLLSAIEEYC